MKTIRLSGLISLSIGLFFSASVLAVSGTGGSGELFNEIFSESQVDGPCTVRRILFDDSTVYLPADPSNPNAKFHILGWGNGTGGTKDTYVTLLESVASHCVIVAAAHTENSGSGLDIQNAVNTARSAFSYLLIESIDYQRVCTAGHSQGGGGAFNAANLLDADCVIAVQADTRHTVQINESLASDVEVIALWSDGDTLAPAGSEYFTSNTRNVEANSSILTEIETAGEDHFTITQGRGGNIGTMFRLAVKAELGNDKFEWGRYRRAFWGPETDVTASSNASQISEVERNLGALRAEPDLWTLD